MANADNAFGFELWTAEGKDNRVRYYDKHTNAIYPGDVLGLLASGKADVAAAGDKILGIAAAFRSAASTEKVPVYDDPQSEFVVQVSANYSDPADVGQLANIVANAADTTLKRSNHALDSASFATTLTLQFRILGLAVRGENASGSYAIVRVRPNHHVFSAGFAGV